MLDFLIFTCLILIITLWLQSKPFTWMGKGIPWKLPLPLFGNTLNLLYKPWHIFWRDFYSSVGDRRFCGFHYFSKPALLVKDFELLKKIGISDADHFMARDFGVPSADPISSSLFFQNGSIWKGQRVRMTPYFTPSRIKAMMPYIHPISDRFVEYVSQESQKGPINPQECSLKMATDVIMANVFGLQPDAFDNPDSFFYNLQSELMGYDTGVRIGIFAMAPNLSKMLGTTFFRSSTIRKLTNLLNNVIAQRSSGTSVRPDFLQGMIELMKKDQISNGHSKLSNSDVAVFDERTVLGQCALMYLAGTETTGNTLGFLMYELALHQDIQARLRDEINDMIQSTSGKYGVEELTKLSYMDQVMSETLRKYPIVISIGRTSTKPYNLDGIDLPVGTIIHFPLLAIQHDPKLFPEPMNFDPERFSGNATLPGYMPFGIGPRTCIGMKLALVEISLTLCKLLPKYKLVPCDKTPPVAKFSSSPTLAPESPLWINVEPIQ